MYCYKCGTECGETARYCKNCGANLTMLHPTAPPAQPPKNGKGFAITSMVCGILSFFYYGIVPGILAIIFGGIARAKKHKGGMSAAGIICGTLGLILWIFIFAVTMSSLGDSFEASLAYIEATGIELPEYEHYSMHDTRNDLFDSGILYVTCSFDEENGAILAEDLEESPLWKALPATENLNVMLYGGEIDGVSYDYKLAKRVGLDEIEDGYWYFYNLQNGAMYAHSDETLLDQSSFEIICAIYDTDERVLHYIKYDK